MATNEDLSIESYTADVISALPTTSRQKADDATRMLLMAPAKPNHGRERDPRECLRLFTKRFRSFWPSAAARPTAALSSYPDNLCIVVSAKFR